MKAEILSESLTEWDGKVHVRCRPPYQGEHDWLLLCVGFDEFADDLSAVATRLYPANWRGEVDEEDMPEVFDTVDFRGVLNDLGYLVVDNRYETADGKVH